MLTSSGFLSVDFKGPKSEKILNLNEKGMKNFRPKIAYNLDLDFLN